MVSGVVKMSGGESPVYRRESGGLLCSALLALLLLLLPGITFAQTDDEVIRRIHSIELRLVGAEAWADLWYYGWVGIFASSMTITLVLSVQQVHDFDDGRRADFAVNGVKSLLGVLDMVLMQKPYARFGADELQALPDRTPEQRRIKLARAEALLRRNAKQTRTRYNLLRHVGNAVVNLAGGAIVGFGFGDHRNGWISAAVGLVGGELVIWTQPWQAERDLREYERRFNGSNLPQSPGPSLSVGPLPGGLVLTLSF